MSKYSHEEEGFDKMEFHFFISFSVTVVYNGINI